MAGPGWWLHVGKVRVRAHVCGLSLSLSFSVLARRERESVTIDKEDSLLNTSGKL